ncbi:MAG: hypothetical protein H7328_02610 [Bdellovibrio sp.]|nr:hypothetical protein [Bdellovibrio sp.]
MKNIFAIVVALGLSMSAVASQEGLYRMQLTTEMTEFIGVADKLELLNEDGLASALVENINLDAKVWSSLAAEQKENLVRRVVEEFKKQ